LKTARPGLL